MNSAVGTFTVEDSFRITGRGLVLAGKVIGQVAPGYQLVFEDDTSWRIKAVEFANIHNQYEKAGLLVDAPLATREELQERGIIGATAQIFAP